MKKIYSLIALAATSLTFAQQYNLVTSQSDITVNGKYLIAARNTSTSGTNAGKVYVMSATQNANNRAAINIASTTSIPQSITFVESYASFQLAAGTITTNSYSFFDSQYEEGGGYIYAASSTSNNLRTQITNTANGEFSIIIDPNNSSATITAKGDITRNIIRFNGSNSPEIFSCYASGQMAVYLYKLAQAVTPTLTTDVTSLSDFEYTVGNGPSEWQGFELTGSNLTNENITITAPAGYQVSKENISYAQSVTLENYTGTAQVIYVKLASDLTVGEKNGQITITGGGITTPLTINLEGVVNDVIANPDLSSNVIEITNLNYFGSQGPSTSQNFNLSGTELNNSDVIITAPTNFEVSFDNVAFGMTATLPAFNGVSTPIYVRLVAGLTLGLYNGQLSINGGGIAIPLSIAVSGEVTDPNVSVKDNSIEGLKIYPNPASEIINITSNEIGNKEVTIFNMLGKKVLETTTNETISISNLTPGVYIINIKQDGKKASSKLVIK